MCAVRLSYVLLYVADLQSSLAFYRDGVGLEWVDGGQGFARLRAPGVADGCLLALHAAPPDRTSRNVQLHFDVPDAAAAQIELQQRGLRFVGQPRRQPWGALVATASDPEGNAVEFVQWLEGTDHQGTGPSPA